MIKDLPERLFLKHILEGLIHNVNTPLNLILGYCQHLQKKYPDEIMIGKIFDAGIRIDELNQLSYQGLISSCNQKAVSFDLNNWLKTELVFLQNDLFLKHRLNIQHRLSDSEIKIFTIPALLEIILESILYSLVADPETECNSVSIESEQLSDYATISIQSSCINLDLVKQIIPAIERLQADYLGQAKLDQYKLSLKTIQHNNSQSITIRIDTV